jgi:diguanylate cyclase (GGDEF)-like protein
MRSGAGPALAALGALYLVLLVVAPAASAWLVGGLLLVALGLAAWTFTATSHAAARAGAAWVPVHAAVAATGGLASPLIVLLGAWVAWVGVARRGWRPAAAGVAVLLPLAAQFLAPAPLDLWDVTRLLLLALFASAVAFVPERIAGGAPREARPAASPNTRGPAPPAAGDDERVLAEACEVARRIAGAEEAALWRSDGAGGVYRVARAAPASRPADLDGQVALDGHPFGWPLEEGMHVRLERGRKALPTEWAEEMLLVPIAAPWGLLALAYAGPLAEAAEAAAVHAQGHLTALIALLDDRRAARAAARRIAALTDAVRTLPGELQLQEFGVQFVETLRESLGAEGAALALWHDETGTAEIVHVAGDGLSGVRAGEAVGEGGARLALAAKHGVFLNYDDLRRERDSLSLLAVSERWDGPPRSALLAPLLDGERTLGIAVTWHRRPAHFGAPDVEFLRTLCSVAASPLRGARQFEALDRKASTDALTGLPNRRSFEARQSAEASQFARYGRPFALLILDVDHFKRFNDTWGHEAGDRVLQHVAQLLRASLREVDLPARLGGEEFVALMPETSLAAALEAAERVRRTIESNSVVWKGRPLSVTASFGVAASPDCTLDTERLLPLADAALYAAKAAGRNRVAPAPCSDPAEA